jgi:ABC transporter, ATP-binding protein
MSGLEIPDSGAVYYDQINLADLSEAERTAFRKDQIGFIFQQYYLLPQLTVEQNIKVGAYLAGNQDFEDLIQALGLEEIRYHYPASLSGGQQQRVAIARALAKKPRVLFLDEPTGALDEATGRQILGYISRLQGQTGVTLVMVTHNEHIAQMANRVVRMNSGQIQSITYNETRLSADEIGW